MIRISSFSIASILTFLFSVIVKSIRTENLSPEELVALTRDHTGRENPDELLNGFIPVWAIVIYIIAATFLVMAVFSGVCYLLGCKNPNKTVYAAVNN